MLVSYLAWATPQFPDLHPRDRGLLATLVTIGLLTKSSELIVMRACGVSLYRTALPLSASRPRGQRGALCVPRTRALDHQPACRVSQPHHSATARHRPSTCSDRKWLIGRRQRDVSLRLLRSEPPRAHAAVGVRVRPEQRPPSRGGPIAVRRPMFRGPATNDTTPWEARRAGSANSRATTSSASRIPGRRACRSSPPTHFVTETPEPDRMNFAELSAYIEGLKASGYNVLGIRSRAATQDRVSVRHGHHDVDRRTVRRHDRKARGDVWHRRRHRARARLLDDDQRLCRARAAGLVPPTLAAWAANLIFGAAAVSAAPRTVRRRAAARAASRDPAGHRLPLICSASRWSPRCMAFFG